jgi:hypothetical protein
MIEVLGLKEGILRLMIGVPRLKEAIVSTPCMKPALSRHRRQPQADRHDGDGVEVG